LVSKTIEQALIEVLEEEEIATLQKQQRKFLELRAAEKAEQQRLEEQERRLREEKVSLTVLYILYIYLT
jgi:BRCT domain type II-containing protein